MLSISISAQLHPTEDPDKVIKAILNIFPDARVNPGGQEITGTTESIDRFKTILYEQRIRGAARGVLIKGRDCNRLCFSLNKQAAFAGKISFGLKATPLGNIRVEVQTDNLDELIDDIAPRPPPVKQAVKSIRNSIPTVTEDIEPEDNLELEF